MDDLLKNRGEVYAVAYFGAILVMALVEWWVPRRPTSDLVRVRWLGNFSVTILGSMLVRLLFPLTGVAWALFCRERGLGLFHHVDWPAWIVYPLTIVIIDLSHYAQHYIFHRVPLLWRLHRAHHTDLECDLSTGLRFHPFEHVASTITLMLVVAALGAPPIAVLISQSLTIIADFVEHANVRVPSSLDRYLRLIVVTPDMHRVHHSQEHREGNSNFSNVLSIWDRLFGTYVAQPAAGHDDIAFGVPGFTDRKHQRLDWMLVQPFLGQTSPEGGPAVLSEEPAGKSPR